MSDVKQKIRKMIREEIIKSRSDKLFINDIVDVLNKNKFKTKLNAANGTLLITRNDDEHVYLEYRY